MWIDHVDEYLFAGPFAEDEQIGIHRLGLTVALVWDEERPGLSSKLRRNPRYPVLFSSASKAAFPTCRGAAEPCRLRRRRWWSYEVGCGVTSMTVCGLNGVGSGRSESPRRLSYSTSDASATALIAAAM